jgi:hypothetical protein
MFILLHYKKVDMMTPDDHGEEGHDDHGEESHDADEKGPDDQKRP